MKPIKRPLDTQDPFFMDWYHSIQKAHKERQKTMFDYVPKPYGEKRTYSQDWTAYDLAKTNEDQLLKQLLRELLFLAEVDEPKTSVGRKGYSKSDRIFCATIRAYANSSMRKTESMLKDLKRLGYIRKVPCFKSIDNFVKDIELAPILDRLITLTTLPLIEFENYAAIDASGFALSRYAQWNAYKWGKETGRERMWRKAHLLCGCRTNIILSIKMTRKDVGDSRLFKMLAPEARRYFDIQNIVADKAYCSRENLRFAHEIGMMPFIPFKKNMKAKRKGKGGIWREMYLFFQKRADEFNRHYHHRSNVETAFHMLKQRFGSNLTTKSFEANGVELKFKAFCHNLCVLIQESFEMGAEIDFLSCVKMPERQKIMP